MKTTEKCFEHRINRENAKKNGQHKTQNFLSNYIKFIDDVYVQDQNNINVCARNHLYIVYTQ